MVDLEKLLKGIQDVRSCPSTLALCLDCWIFAQAHGEVAGCELATVILEGVREYRAISRSRSAAADGTGAGTILGSKPVPLSGEYWWVSVKKMASKDKVSMGLARSGASVPDGLILWCVDSSGWWRRG